MTTGLTVAYGLVQRELAEARRENAALREWQTFALAALGMLRDGMPEADVLAVQRFIDATRTEGHSQGSGYAPIVPGPAKDDGTGRKSAYDTTWSDMHAKQVHRKGDAP